MKCVFVNQSPPAMAHVSAVRLRRFAAELARLGHQIVLLTSDGSDVRGRKPVEAVRAELGTHDWSKPYHLPCAMEPSRALRLLRGGRLPPLARKATIGWQYWRRSGLNGDWVDGSRQYWALLADEFAADLTWATFGCTDALAIAQGISRVGHIPWVMDVKDGWDPFIPRALRDVIARRFLDATWITSNSQLSADIAARWFPQRQTTVYSGLDTALLEASVPEEDRGEFRLVLSGSLDRLDVLKAFLDGVEQWLDRQSGGERSTCVVTYAGSGADWVRRCTEPLAKRCRVEIHDYLPYREYLAVIRSASVNAYLWSPRTFHHKLIELLACGKPVVAFPGEHEESRAIARRLSSGLLCCASTTELARCLEEIRRVGPGRAASVDRTALREFTWAMQARRLVEVFEAVVGRRSRTATKAG